ncbi:MAG: hypothetical protein AAF376_17120 [Pseudomonadota bacterium]
MTRVYWYGMAIIYLACCATGMILGYHWGIGGSILGTVLGAMVASMVAMVLNTPERMETALYSLLSIGVVSGLIYLIVAFWGVRF